MRALLLLCFLSMVSQGYAQQARLNELPEVVYIPPASGKYVWERVAQIKGRILFNNTIACSDSVMYSFGGYDTLRVQREMNRLVGRRVIKDTLRYPGQGFKSNVFFIRDSLMYLGGGHDSGASRYAWNDFWQYNLHTHLWKRLNDLPFYYGRPPVVFIENDQIIVLIARLQGQDFHEAVPVFYEYEPETDRWTVISHELSSADIFTEQVNKPNVNTMYPVAFKIDQSIFVLFQRVCMRDWNNCSIPFYKFDLKSGEWTMLPPFPGRTKTWSFALSDGRYGYIGGGNTGRSALDRKDVFRYDQQIGKWEQITSMPRGVRYAKGWRFRGESYVGFGINDKFNTVVVWKMKQKK